MKNVIWMMVTSDELELPIAVANSAPELGRIVGVSPKTISAVVNKYDKGKKKTCRYRRVVIDDE